MVKAHTNALTCAVAATLSLVFAEKLWPYLMPPTEEITLNEEKLKQGKSGSREGNERRLDQSAGLYSSHRSSATNRSGASVFSRRRRCYATY